ncbi:UNVERIFIED_CONTAM: hypothetical protein FKN15_008818 [Acipenser sinensis]
MIPDPNGVMIPDPSGAMIPDPNGVMIPDPSGAMIPDPNGVMIPDPSGAMIPDPSCAMIPDPSGAMILDPSGAVIPDPSDAMIPDPSGAVIPDPSGAMIPDPSGAMIPDPSGAMIPDPSGAIFPFKHILNQCQPNLLVMAFSVFDCVLQILADIEKHSPNGQEEEDWEKALSVERFGDFISETSSRHTEKTGRSYNERDFEYHRHTSHHTHHPLSTHLPPTMRFRKRVFRIDRRKKKKRKKKKTSVPPSDVTPTIHEVDEEEEESDAEGRRQGAMPTPPLDDKPKFSIGVEEDHTQPLPFQNFHVENECTPSPESPPSTSAPVMKLDPLGWGETLSRFSQLPQDTLDLPSRGWFKRKPLHRLTGGQRASYDLRERICIGSMTAMETAIYQKVPTDEAEAQMLASADLDGMKRISLFCLPGTSAHTTAAMLAPGINHSAASPAHQHDNRLD